MQARSLWRGMISLLALPVAAGATNHSVQIDEVMAGAFGRTDVQFIEMKFPCGQNSWANKARLVFYDMAGTETGQFVIPSDPVTDCSTATFKSALIGTQAYADLTDVPDPDFIMPAGILPASGKVCWRGIPPSGFEVTMCMTYGSFSGDKEGAGASNAATLPSNAFCSLRRNRNFFSTGSPNLNSDFDLLSPSPRNNAGVTGAFSSVPPRFADVTFANPFFRFIEAMFNAGVTSGCGGGNYCPGNGVTREQMAVFLLRSKLGTGFAPPACATQVFNDVPCSSPFAPWINELAARGITGGCGGGNYCPGNVVTREQMAVFLLVTLEGNAFTPPACVTEVFSDVPCTSPFASWINELAARGISGGCNTGTFCPGNTVTREQMAVFLSTAFSLPVPQFSCPVSASLVSDGEAPADDHGNTPETATVILSDGDRFAGDLESEEDVDFFAFDAEEGDFVFVQTEMLDFDDDTHLRILDGEGKTLTESFDHLSYGWSGGGAFTQFMAPATGTYFIRVKALSPGQEGRYELSAQRFAD